MTLTVLAPVKINIALHVGPPQTDGYHPVDTLCVFPALGDVLSYQPGGSPGIDFAGPYGAALAKEPIAHNLIFKAFALSGMLPEGRFFLNKVTPLASGMGAGTADGAAAMLLLNEAHGLGLTADDLILAARGLGADGPVCMAGQIYAGGLWRAEGIGEQVGVVGRVEPQAILLANPGEAVPTGQVFRLFDRDRPSELDSAPARRGETLAQLIRTTRNDLARPAQTICPAITELLDQLSAHPGATEVRMSGSGATCYALHASLASASRAAATLRADGLWAEAAPLLPGMAAL